MDKEKQRRMGRLNGIYGKGFERVIENLHKTVGILCGRTFSRQSACREKLTDEKAYDLDIQIAVGDQIETVRGECKASRSHNGYSKIVEWMKNSDLLFLKVSRGEPLVVMPFSRYSQLVRGDKNYDPPSKDNTEIE